MAFVLADAAQVLGDIWADITGDQPPPADGFVLLSAAVALALVLWPAAWSRTRSVVTIAHEGAHGLVAILTGRTLLGMRVHHDTSGLAVSRGRADGPGMVATAAAGYPGPALLGLLGAFLISRGHALAVLWLAVLLLGLMLLMMRNLYGLASVLVTLAAVVGVSWWGEPSAQWLAASTGTWFLLLASPRPVIEVQRTRRRGRGHGSDPDLLAVLTHVPGTLWVGFFLVVTVGAAVAGAAMLTTGLR